MLVKAQGTLVTGRQASEGGSAHPSTWGSLHQLSAHASYIKTRVTACPLQRAEAFDNQLAKMVEIAFRKKHTGVRHQRWLLQEGW